MNKKELTLKNLSRRSFIKTVPTATGLIWAAGNTLPLKLPFTAGIAQATENYELPFIQYPYKALEPYIDAKTLAIHHMEIQAHYVAQLQAIMYRTPQWRLGLRETLSRLEVIPSLVRMNIRNFGGGHWNHSFFWEIMTPGGSKAPMGLLAKALRATFGGFDAFKKAFKKAGLGVFGSGWVWLVKDFGKLHIVTTAEEENPLMTGDGEPILGLDVWEHAYYLKYQNLRGDYIDNWWNVVNWDVVFEKYRQDAE